MQAYIEEEIEFNANNTKIMFYGSNFNLSFKKQYNEFKTEKLTDIRTIKKLLESNMPQEITLCGGEPFLQRQALIQLINICNNLNILCNIETNATKTKNIIDIINSKTIHKLIIVLIAGKTNFKRLTGAGTFFEPAEQVFESIKKTLKEVQNNKNIEFKSYLVPGLIYRYEILEEIAELIGNKNRVWIWEQIVQDNIKQLPFGLIENLKEKINKKYPMINIEF